MGKNKHQPVQGRMISENDRELLHSILDNDNARIIHEIAKAKSDVVFKLGYEGGFFEVKRYTTADFKVYFRISGTSITLDENEDEKWINWEDDPVVTFDGALAELGLGKDTLCLRPTVVHPDYRPTVRKHIESLLAEVTPDDRRRMGSFLAASADQWFGRLDRNDSGANQAKSRRK